MINIYWSCLDDNWLRAEEPESVLKSYFRSDKYDGNNKNLELQYCPGFNNNLKNVFLIKSINDYSFTIINNEVVSDMYDQDFFNKKVLIRSMEKKVFSFSMPYIFFTDSDSLEMTAYEYPFLEENNITKSCIPIPGKFNIGKWFRPLEFSFYLKKEIDTFTVENKEVLYYIRFHTDEKINFKQFRTTDLIKSFCRENFSSTTFISKKMSKEGGLQYFYGLLKTKKLILKEIKENLI